MNDLPRELRQQLYDLIGATGAVAMSAEENLPIYTEGSLLGVLPLTTKLERDGETVNLGLYIGRLHTRDKHHSRRWRLGYETLTSDHAANAVVTSVESTSYKYALAQLLLNMLHLGWRPQ